ncbi:MAG: hypothetical protein IPI34_13630 [bacterium]|nr:hypothetical protein [bacterium]
MNYAVYRKVLLMVSELHVRGYQRLRISPGVSPTGFHWRCNITPASNILSSHGAILAEASDLVACYSSASEASYFNWKDAAHLTPSRMAVLFMERYSSLVRAGHGSDWLYAGWYQEMLGITYPDLFPIAYDDDGDMEDCLGAIGGREGVTIPLPPPGEYVSTSDG